MKKELRSEGQLRLQAAGRRTQEIYKRVGCLATHFSGLESTLIHVTARLGTQADLDREMERLSSLTFRKTIEEFRKAKAKRFTDPKVLSELDDLIAELIQAGDERNDILHSAWIAYSSSQYGQHRPRSKKANRRGQQIHAVNPTKHIDEATKRVEKLVFELFCIDLELE